MRNLLSLFCAFLIMSAVMLVPMAAQGFMGGGEPLKYISSCEIDLNNDDQPDIAFLVETLLGRELIVLLRTDKGYNAFLVSKNAEGMYLSCHVGNTVRESEAFDDPKVYKTPGAYLELYLPEGAAAAYFWNGSGFTEVWTAD